MFLNLLRYKGNDLCVGQHAGFEGRGTYVLDHSIDLSSDQSRRQFHDLGNPLSILRSDCGDDRGAIDPEGGEGLEIGLNSRSCARVRPSNGHDLIYSPHEIPS